MTYSASHRKILRLPQHPQMLQSFCRCGQSELDKHMRMGVRLSVAVVQLQISQLPSHWL